MCVKSSPVHNRDGMFLSRTSEIQRITAAADHCRVWGILLQLFPRLRRLERLGAYSGFISVVRVQEIDEPLGTTWFLFESPKHIRSSLPMR